MSHQCHYSIQVTRRPRNRKAFFEPLWEVVAPKLREIFSETDAKGNFVMYEHKSHCDDRNGVGKTKLAPLGHEQVLDVTAPNLCEPCISDVVLQQNVSEASTPAQIREAAV